MKMTDEERFRFDLNGYLLRPAILSQDEIDAIVDQIDRIKHDPESLPPEHRAVPGGPSSVVIDHPMVIGVLHDIIGPEIRMESSFCIWRQRGQSAGGLHGGGPSQGDPIFGYRVRNGRIHAGMVRVAIELTAVSKEDGGTHFIPGSHKSNFPMHPDHMSLEDGKRSPFLTQLRLPRRQRALLHREPVPCGSRLEARHAAHHDLQRLRASGDALAPVDDSARRVERPAAREAGVFQGAMGRRFPHAPRDAQHD